MEKEPPPSAINYGAYYDETQLSKNTDLKNTKGSLFFSPKTSKKKRSFKWIRIRSFFISHKKFKRLTEFSIHPTGIHMLRMAVFHSENGCGMCKVYVEKNLF